MKEINVITAFEKSNTTLFVDVRERDEVSQLTYNVPNYMNIPLSELASSFEKIPQNTEIILACRSGKRSQHAQEFLLEQGYTQTYNLQGGILAWHENNLPVK